MKQKKMNKTKTNMNVVAEVLDMATNMKADGQTAPAASLWPYYQQKKVVRMFIVVTDEVENGKYKVKNLQNIE